MKKKSDRRNKMTDKKDYMTIEELKAQKDTSNAVFAGVKQPMDGEQERWSRNRNMMQR